MHVIHILFVSNLFLFLHHHGRMVGGDDEDHNKPSLKTKPNRVRGGLMARVQFWEVQTNKKQSGNTSEAFTNDDLGRGFSDRDRKEI